MKLVVFRPEGAQDLAQGKATVSIDTEPPPWDSSLPNIQPPCKGKRLIAITGQNYLALSGRQFFVGSVSQGVALVVPHMFLALGNLAKTNILSNLGKFAPAAA